MSRSIDRERAGAERRETLSRFAHAALVGTLIAALATPAGAALDQGQIFENFFATSCDLGSVSGALQDRCNDRFDPGDPPANPDEPLSGDSQNSLVPTHALSSNENILFRAQSLSRQAGERLETRRRGDPDEAVMGASAAMAFDMGALSMFVNGRGTWFDKGAGANERAFKGSTGGFQLGGDYRLSDVLVVGGLFAYDRTSSTFDPDRMPGANFTPPSNNGTNDSNTYTFLAFASLNITDNLWIDGSFGGGFSSHTFVRNGVFQLSSRPADPTKNFAMSTLAKPDGSEVSASAGIGYDWFDGAYSAGPYVRWSYARSSIDGYTEQDRLSSGMQLEIDENVRSSLTSVVGLHGSTAISTAWGVIVPQARLEWEHEYDRNSQIATAVFVGDAAGIQQRFDGDNPDRDFFNAGASLVMVLPDGWLPFIDFESIFGYRQLSRYRLTGGLRREF